MEQKTNSHLLTPTEIKAELEKTINGEGSIFQIRALEELLRLSNANPSCVLLNNTETTYDSHRSQKERRDLPADLDYT
jgi:hypothetical protein